MITINTIVVPFGAESSGAASTVLIETDDVLNASDGEVRTQFDPGDIIYFLVHYSSNVNILSVKSTGGQMRFIEKTTRPKEQQVLFALADETAQLSYIPSSSVSGSWYGRNGLGLDVDGQAVSVAGGVPCLGDISFNIRADIWQLETPNVSIAEGASYPIGVVVYYNEDG